MNIRESLARIILYTALLSGVWFILSGRFDLLHFGTGVATATVIAASVRRVKDERRFRLGRFLMFLPWLVRQIIISNLRVARLVLSRRMDIRPIFISQPPGVAGDRALTILGTSITLTPGILAVEIDADDMFVHALDSKSVDDTREELMSVQVSRLFTMRVQ